MIRIAGPMARGVIATPDGKITITLTTSAAKHADDGRHYVIELDRRQAVDLMQQLHRALRMGPSETPAGYPENPELPLLMPARRTDETQE